MPAISPSKIVNVILDSIQQSGGAGGYLSPSVTGHPRKFALNYFGKGFTLWVYIWTLTHGGRPSLPDEYRIQMTSITSPLELNPSGETVLLGYHPDTQMFAGFDINKHRFFTSGSPSVQVDISTLYSAMQNGIAFSQKENDEIVVGIHPEQMINYILDATSLHKFGAEAKMLGLLKGAVTLESNTALDISTLTEKRKQVVSTVIKNSRAHGFKGKVLGAYQNRCAVSRAQLRLLDAAHILPVASAESSDHVTNGLALAPTLHRAYDNCLIYLDEDYIMRLNTTKSAELEVNNLHAGLPQLESLLNKVVHLPMDVSQRPHVDYIKLANKYRRIPGYC